MVIISSTSGSVANNLSGNLQTPPEVADTKSWVLWLERNNAIFNKVYFNQVINPHAF